MLLDASNLAKCIALKWGIEYRPPFDRNRQVEAVEGNIAQDWWLFGQAFCGEPCSLARQSNIEVDQRRFRSQPDQRKARDQGRYRRHLRLNRSHLCRQYRVDHVEVGLQLLNAF